MMWSWQASIKVEVSVHTESESVAQSQAIRIYLMFNLELHIVLSRRDRVKWQVYKALSFMSICVFLWQLAVFVFTQICVFICINKCIYVFIHLFIYLFDQKIFFKCCQYLIVTFSLIMLIFLRYFFVFPSHFVKNIHFKRKDLISHHGTYFSLSCYYLEPLRVLQRTFFSWI